MLGMGADGHTASLFPGSDPREGEERLARAVWVENMSVHRITLTPAVINRGRHVVIAVEGAAKAAMLRSVREGVYDPVRHPVQIVSPVDGNLEWFADRDAAGIT
jgi:6-phosphogluconolactonase